MEDNRPNWHHFCKQMQMFALDKTHPHQLIFVFVSPLLLLE